MAEEATELKGWFPRWRSGAEARAARRALIRLLPQISPVMTAALLAITVISIAVDLVFLLATGRLIGAVPKAVAAGGLDTPDGSRLISALVAVSVIFLIDQFVGPFRNLTIESLGRRVDTELQRRVMEAMLEPTGIAHLEDPANLDLIRDVKGIGTGQWTPGGAVEGLAQNLAYRLKTLTHGVLIFTFAWWLAPLLLIFGAVVRFRLVDDALRGASWGRTQTPKLRRSDYLRDLGLTPDAAKESRVFGLGAWILERFSADWLDAMKEIWRQRKAQAVSSWAWSLPWGGLTLFSLYLVASSAASGDIDIGQLAVYAQAVLGASSIWLSNADVWVAYGALAVPAVRKLEALEEARVSGTADPSNVPASSIRFEGVGFGYVGRDEMVFDGLDLEIPAGRSIAIVGRNGAGKTTLVKLLARLYEPSSGQITVDGTDIASFDPKLWQRRIGALFQDFVRYELAAKRNVSYGCIEIAGLEDEVIGAATDAGVGPIVDKLKHGWDTILSREYSDGAELSGGEWQRMAIARALMAVRGGAGILVLDEPTANLDVRAEAEVFDRFLELTRGLTTILISHRFSTVRHADHIVVLEGGQVIEQGSHDELIVLGGRYAHMFTLQAARFQDEEAVEAEEAPVDA